jgi:hypothetical protein
MISETDRLSFGESQVGNPQAAAAWSTKYAQDGASGLAPGGNRRRQVVYKEVLKNILRPPARAVFSTLSWIEGQVSPEYELHYSPTFIIGAPRSGSTLLYQLMAYALSISYFTNLTGRFRVQGSPAIPILTARLVKALNLVDRRHETFENYYGYGKGWGGPHPGLEIWDRWFPDGYAGPETLCAKHRRAIYQAVAATERVFDRPMVSKEQKHSVRIQALVEVFPNALFIQCLRDPLDMAQSIFIARTREFPYLPDKPKDPSRAWFSVKPKEYDSIKDKGLIEQVCEQVYFTEQNIAADRTVVGEDRFHCVSYQDLCRDPRQELCKTAEFMSQRGAPTQIIRSVPDSFDFSTGCKIDPPSYRAMEQVLTALYDQQQ